MPTTAGGPPAHDTPADLALGFLTGGVIGGSLTAFIGGCVAEEASLIVTGLVLPAVYGLAFFLCTPPRRARRSPGSSVAWRPPRPRPPTYRSGSS
ncbi:hypothetical protein [Streptomyces sp. NPDC058486]|uniref:hypothetical protein n=1 Tax=unclassified Streptomyces TaxID=2593676 RepID=UPI003661C037